MSISVLPLYFVDKSLDELVKHKRINIFDEDSISYSISANENKIANERLDEITQVEERLINQFYDNLGFREKLEEEDLKILWDKFYLLLGEIASSDGQAFANSSLNCTNDGKLNFGNGLTFEDYYLRLEPLNPFMFEDKLGMDVDVENRVKTSIIEILTENTTEINKYLFWIAQGYFFAQIMNIDPKCQNYTLKSLEQIEVYLDTNILYQYFGKLPSETGLSIRTFINFLVRIGVKVKITSKTILEFSNSINHKRTQAQAFRNMPPDRAHKLLKLVEDQAVRGFLVRRESSPDLTWDKFLDLILANFDPGQKKFEAVEIDEEMDKLYKSDESLENSVRQFGPWKSNNVAAHDAFHISYLSKKRTETSSGIIGPVYWFLTTDRSLQRVEKEYFGSESLPVSIFSHVLFGILSPIIPPKIREENPEDFYTHLFSSQLFQAGNTLTIREISELQGKWMDDIDENSLVQTLGSTYVRQKLRMLKTEEEMDQDESLRDMNEEIVTDVVSRAYDHKIEQINKDLTEKQMDIINLQDDKVKGNQEIIDLKESLDQLKIKQSEDQKILDQKEVERKKLKSIELIIMVSVLGILLILNWIIKFGWGVFAFLFAVVYGAIQAYYMWKNSK